MIEKSAKGGGAMAETKRCIQCGAVLPEDAAFCPHCTATQVTR